MELGCIQHVYQETIAKFYIFFIFIRIVEKIYSTHIYMEFKRDKNLA